MRSRSTPSVSLLEYQRRIDQAIRFILARIDQPISLDEVAEAACFSKFHFHRLFTALMNEPPGEYIMRKRLERAAIRLVYADTPVSTLAGDYGYSSVAAFSKAFRQWFGGPPTAIKAIRGRLESEKGKLQTRYGKTLVADELFGAAAGAGNPARRESIRRRVILRRLKEFELHYLPSARGYEVGGIWETWATLREQACAVAPEADCDWFALSHDHPGLTPPDRCRYDACVALPKKARAALPLPRLAVPGGDVAVYQVAGPEASILPQYLDFYTHWMPHSGFEPADYPLIEHYLPGCRPGHIRVQLWVKVQPMRMAPGRVS
ncbi:AraC family transcriptional regulator [Alcanivorax sp. 521-1]|uniref:AraC family transcriptional regulator n=1 Tax=Alloalcanivorax profundimaris TaxID=2735259 RepID=A0ABS0AN92_9GAMM|nr:helix-turn-helix domain-containing protein [Alloalcanivorax profundimaris]MBF5054951.1 AraC family transcriptional regulator [Alloalcanivorax profundimaris]